MKMTRAQTAGGTKSLKMDSSFLRHGVVTLFVIMTIAVHDVAFAFDPQAVNNVLEQATACKSYSNQAVALSVVKDGQIVLSRGYGKTREDGAKRVANTTRFGMASLSKAFAATLFLKVMHDDGRFNLSSKVVDILGEDFRFHDEFRTKDATVEDLLAHKMAIPANNRLRFNSNLTRENLQDRLQYLSSPEGFRNVFKYSNLMYGLITRMTEIVGGDTWENLLKKVIFQPLGMTRSTFSDEVDQDDPDMAQGMAFYNQSLRVSSPFLPPLWAELAGSGSVVSTATDMALWMNFHLSQGKNQEGQTVVEADLMEEMYKPRTAVNKNLLSKFTQPEIPVSMSLDVYGLGWRLGYYRGYATVAHSGSTWGYRNLLTLVPSLNLGVFTTMSGGDYSYVFRGPLHAYLLDQLMGVKSWLNHTSLCSFPEPWLRSKPSVKPWFEARPLAHNLSAYLGVYENPAYGRLEVRAWDPTPDPSSEPTSHLTVFYGFGTWDLVRKPTYGPASPNHSEYLYGKGRNYTAWVDYSPFIFYPPPKGSDVIERLTVPGFEAADPPLFIRVRPGKLPSSGCGTIAFGYSLLCTFAALVCYLRSE